MIHAHMELYRRLSPVQTLALWNELYVADLVNDPPDTMCSRGEVLAEKCKHLSHAEVVLSISAKAEPFWCDVLCCLLEKPIYMCARGETSIHLTDVEGRPLPLPIGHRRGDLVGAGALPKRIAQRVQYQKKIDPRIITLVSTLNPKLPGTKSHERFSMYRSGMSVTEYMLLGGLAGDIIHDGKRGYISVDIP